MEKVEKSSHINSICFIGILLTILMLVVYSNSFQASWQLDDKPNILKNLPIQLKQISLSDIIQTAFAKPGSGGLYRPVACITLALNWFCGQENVFGYHVVNFLIHCLTALFLFLTIKTLFSTPRLQNNYNQFQIELIAVITVLFWALNPIHVQAVTYIVQRMTSLAAMFSILCIFFFLKSRLTKSSLKHILLLVSAVISYLFAVLSKENAVTVILILPVLEVLFFKHRLTRPFFYRAMGWLITGCLISLLAGFALRPELFDFIVNYYSNRPFTLSERVLTEQRIILYYLSLLFFPAPARLSIEHDIILSTSFFQPWTTGASIIVNILLLVLALKMYKRHPIFTLAILFFFLNHLVESTIVPLELIFEHRNYLPSLFLFLPLAQAFSWIFNRWQGDRLLTLFITGLLTFVFIVEGYATYERNKAWKTEESLWLDALVKAPNSSRPLATLAIKLAWGPDPSTEKYRKALILTERTLSMRMSRRRLDAAQYGNMASIYNKLGEYENANEYYGKALGIAPEDASIRYNYCKNLIMMGSFQRAREEMISIVDKGFVHPDYFNMIGFIDLWMGQPEKALPSIQQAMKYSPGRPDILLNLGKCLSLLGYYDRANWFFSFAKKNGRDDAVVSLSVIENALKSNRSELAEVELKLSLKKFSLPYFFKPINAPFYERYREVPLDNKILTQYIRSELSDIMPQLLP